MSLSTSSLDQPLPILARAHARPWASPLTPEAGHRLTNKDVMKQVLREDGVDTARRGDVLVEEFIEGLELRIDCMVIGGKVHVLLARHRPSL